MTASNGWIRIYGKNIALEATNELLLQGKRVILGNANGTTEQTQILGSQIAINGAQEVIIVGSQKISKSNKGLLLKSSVINAMASNPPTASLIAAFVPSGFGAKIRPGER